jgi:hypothetical protein
MYKNCIVRFIPIEGLRGWSRLLISQEGSERHMQLPMKGRSAEVAMRTLKKWKEEK